MTTIKLSYTVVTCEAVQPGLVKVTCSSDGIQQWGSNTEGELTMFIPIGDQPKIGQQAEITVELG